MLMRMRKNPTIRIDQSTSIVVSCRASIILILLLALNVPDHD